MNLLAVIAAFFGGFIIYRTGFKDGNTASSGAKIGNLIPKKHKVSADEERLNRGMCNILNYANRRRKGDGENE